MILIPLLVGIASGAAAATAACLAWRTGALEDERARSTRLEKELVATRRERDEARRQVADDPTEKLLEDVRREVKRSGRHRQVRHG